MVYMLKIENTSYLVESGIKQTSNSRGLSLRHANACSFFIYSGLPLAAHPFVRWPAQNVPFVHQLANRSVCFGIFIIEPKYIER